MRISDWSSDVCSSDLLTHANLFDADLRDGMIAERDRHGNIVAMKYDPGPVEMEGAQMKGANLSSAKMSGAMAHHTDFTDAIMVGCNMVRANLANAHLTNANLYDRKSIV